MHELRLCFGVEFQLQHLELRWEFDLVVFQLYFVWLSGEENGLCRLTMLQFARMRRACLYYRLVAWVAASVESFWYVERSETMVEI